MTAIKAWVTAFRLRTLPLALSTILMGSFLAAYHHFFQWPIFILACLTTLLLQILSNLANDYGDTVNGADHEGRIGPDRMVQSGAITPKAMKVAISVFIALSLISGISLIYVSFKDVVNIKGALFLILGVAAIIAALKYTMGRSPYGYSGKGDLFVLLFFGIVGVGGSYYLYANQLNWTVLLPSLAVGFLSTGVLNLNNMRDEASDRTAGKNTLVVRNGLKWAKNYHYFLVLAALLLSITFILLNEVHLYSFLFLLVTPLLIKHLLVVKNANGSIQFEPELKKLALSTLLYVILFGSGLLIA